MTVPQQRADLWLRGVARGYRQRQILAELLTGKPIIHPCYWRGDGYRSPRWQELKAWEHMRERLVNRGYVLTVVHQETTHPAYTTYTLMTGAAVHHGARGE